MSTLQELRALLELQLEAFDRELRVELPQRIAAAVSMGDLSENAEYTSALERQEFVRARLGQLQRRMSELSRIDLRDVPRDRAGFGSRVEVEDEDGERRTWRLVFPEFVELDGEMVSIASPMGRALVGARPGEQVWLETPDGEVTCTVISVITMHGESISLDDSEGGDG